MTAAIKPDPCPFCRGVAYTQDYEMWSDPPQWNVYCGACGARGPSTADEAAAVAAWNIRHAPAPTDWKPN